MKSLLWGAFMGAMFPMLAWRRQKEVDSYGNLCARYFLLRFTMPLFIVFWIAVGIQNLDNPVYWEHPENFFCLCFFLLFTTLACIHFCFYKISIKSDVIERLQWPLQPLQYNVKDLTFIGKKGNQHVLHFHGDRSFAIPILLSGQAEFIDKAQKLILAHPGQRPFRRRGKRK